jgi:hypothetical protein
VRCQARVRAKAAFLNEVEPAPTVELDQCRIARPRVHAESGALERSAPFDCPDEHRIHQATRGACSGARNAMEIEMFATFVGSPDRSVFIRDGEHASERVIRDHAQESLLVDLSEDRLIGERRPLIATSRALHGAGVLVDSANIRKIVTRRNLASPGRCIRDSTHYVST